MATPTAMARVDLLDLDILGSNFGTSPATFAQGDFNGDNVVDLLDLDILGANFGGASSSFAFSTQGPDYYVHGPSSC